MRKVALVLSSSLSFSPYAQHYLSIFERLGIQCDVIEWDRSCHGSGSEYSYSDNKVGIRRGPMGYLGYVRFIRRKLVENYDFVVVCGIQLTTALAPVLLRRFIGRYIVDIRDYHWAWMLGVAGRVASLARLVVVSSAAYSEFLPRRVNFVVCHNIIYSDDVPSFLDLDWSGKISINYIGAVRDLSAQMSFLRSMASCPGYDVGYYGVGVDSEELERFSASNFPGLAKFHGRYEPSVERSLYEKSHFINSLIPPDSRNNRLLLPNRLYWAAMFGRPLVVSAGGYLGQVVLRHGLGIVLDDYSELAERLSFVSSSASLRADMWGRMDLFRRRVLAENADCYSAIEGAVLEAM